MHPFIATDIRSNLGHQSVKCAVQNHFRTLLCHANMSSTSTSEPSAARRTTLELLVAIFTSERPIRPSAYRSIQLKCVELIRCLRTHCKELGSAIHENYLAHNPHIRTEAPALAVPFHDLPLEEQRKDYDIADMYFSGNKDAFAESFAMNTHSKWLQGYRAKNGDTPRVRGGVRIDLPWQELPMRKQAADVELSQSYADIFFKFDDYMLEVLLGEQTTEPLISIYKILNKTRADAQAQYYIHYDAMMSIILRSF